MAFGWLRLCSTPNGNFVTVLLLNEIFTNSCQLKAIAFEMASIVRGSALFRWKAHWQEMIWHPLPMPLCHWQHHRSFDQFPQCLITKYCNLIPQCHLAVPYKPHTPQPKNICGKSSSPGKERSFVARQLAGLTRRYKYMHLQRRTVPHLPVNELPASALDLMRFHIPQDNRQLEVDRAYCLGE